MLAPFIGADKYLEVKKSVAKSHSYRKAALNWTTAVVSAKYLHGFRGLSASSAIPEVWTRDHYASVRCHLRRAAYGIFTRRRVSVGTFTERTVSTTRSEAPRMSMSYNLSEAVRLSLQLACMPFTRLPIPCAIFGHK